MMTFRRGSMLLLAGQQGSALGSFLFAPPESLQQRLDLVTLAL